MAVVRLTNSKRFRTWTPSTPAGLAHVFEAALAAMAAATSKAPG